MKLKPTPHNRFCTRLTNIKLNPTLKSNRFYNLYNSILAAQPYKIQFNSNRTTV